MTAARLLFCYPCPSSFACRQGDGVVGLGTGWWTRVVFVLKNDESFVVCVLMLACVDPPVACPGRVCPWGLSRWGSSSTVSAGRLHPLRGFHVRSIDHMVSCGVSHHPGGWSGILILERASRLDAFSGYPSRT